MNPAELAQGGPGTLAILAMARHRLGVLDHARLRQRDGKRRDA